MREFYVRKSEIDDFIDHTLAIDMAGVVPAGGKSKH
jgi:hypothetical protein